ncbi:hypothetical protein BC936DRAFT_141152 [Jimgerdemannia flammicorona]|uniref:Uncharacterized protein n=1 Tax=Jimgerdemannia flammicorona TaxID=994334 RepID=A0A433A2T1_9FUNG|nr:hypothetical protein BC936DRAFT_141152 [Jimgerdemannia flammicorona]
MPIIVVITEVVQIDNLGVDSLLLRDATHRHSYGLPLSSQQPARSLHLHKLLQLVRLSSHIAHLLLLANVAGQGLNLALLSPTSPDPTPSYHHHYPAPLAPPSQSSIPTASPPSPSSLPRTFAPPPSPPPSSLLAHPPAHTSHTTPRASRARPRTAPPSPRSQPLRPALLARIVPRLRVRTTAPPPAARAPVLAPCGRTPPPPFAERAIDSCSGSSLGSGSDPDAAHSWGRRRAGLRRGAGRRWYGECAACPGAGAAAGQGCRACPGGRVVAAR